MHSVQLLTRQIGEGGILSKSKETVQSDLINEEIILLTIIIR